MLLPLLWMRGQNVGERKSCPWIRFMALINWTCFKGRLCVWVHYCIPEGQFSLTQTYFQCKIFYFILSVIINNWIKWIRTDMELDLEQALLLGFWVNTAVRPGTQAVQSPSWYSPNTNLPQPPAGKSCHSLTTGWWRGSFKYRNQYRD